MSEFARSMQRLVSNRAWKIGQWVNPTTAEGLRLIARWWYWEARTSRSGSALQYAKRLYARSRELLRPNSQIKQQEER